MHYLATASACVCHVERQSSGNMYFTQVVRVWVVTLKVVRLQPEMHQAKVNWSNMMSDTVVSNCFFTGQHRMLAAGLEIEPKLPNLMNEVAAVIPDKWRDIGIHLGLSHRVLEGIATISPRNTNLCYSNVFTLWENQNSTTHPYTWSTIVKVLQAPSVGEEKLAIKIKNNLTALPPQ